MSSKAQDKLEYALKQTNKHKQTNMEGDEGSEWDVFPNQFPNST